MSSLATAALVAVLLDPAAEPVAVALDWRAPEGCPQRDALEARLGELLPDNVELHSGDAPAQLRIRGAIAAGEGTSFEVGLRFESERGVDERDFAGTDCVVLADAAALVIAVAVDPVAVAQTITVAEDEAEPEDVAEPAPEEPEPSPAPEEPEPPSSETLVISPATPVDVSQADDQLGVRFLFGLLGGAGYGPLRLAQAAVGVELGVFGHRWRASVRGSWLPPRTQTFASGNAARFDGFAIAARGCGVPAAGPVELPICAGVEAGSLRGRGSGSTADPRDANIPWAAVVVGPGLRWPVSDRVAIGVDLELLAPVVRGGFTIDGAVVQDLGPIGVQALAGVELRLP